MTLTHKLLVQVQLRVPFGGRWLGLPHCGGTKGNKTHLNAREMLSITAGALCDESVAKNSRRVPTPKVIVLPLNKSKSFQAGTITAGLALEINKKRERCLRSRRRSVGERILGAGSSSESGV